MMIRIEYVTPRWDTYTINGRYPRDHTFLLGVKNGETFTQRGNRVPLVNRSRKVARFASRVRATPGSRIKEIGPTIRRESVDRFDLARRG